MSPARREETFSSTSSRPSSPRQGWSSCAAGGIPFSRSGSWLRRSRCSWRARRLGGPALLRLSELLGTPQAYLGVRDEVSSSPTTASDTASWFGPGGFLLMVGVGLAATMLIKRRGLPRLARALALAPLLWLALVALTLTYHPWQGRFFVFPVAL